MTEEEFRCGFIGLIGLPNAGKSTLLNSALEQKISIISSKPQTTRNRILGILNAQGVQIALVDTPGIHRPRNRLHKLMVRSAEDIIIEMDAICWVIDVVPLEKRLRTKKELFVGGLKHMLHLLKGHDKVSIALNKVDLIKKNNVLPIIQRLSIELPQAEIIPISAKTSDNVSRLVDVWRSHLPTSPPLFPKEQVTDISERFLVSELIREKVFRLTNQEIPYSVAVEIEAFEELEKYIEIFARIYVEKESQKGIIIGKKGSKLKDIGSRARVEIEQMLGTKVWLNLHVSVREKWTDKPRDLKDLGYQ